MSRSSPSRIAWRTRWPRVAEVVFAASPIVGSIWVTPSETRWVVFGVGVLCILAAVVPLGRPARQVSKLRRGPVEEFARLERWDGPSLGGN